MIRLEEALAIVAAAVRPAGAEDVRLERAEGRVLAADVISDVDWPPFDTTAMDGYAVRLADTVPGEAVSERDGLIAAGDPPPPPLRAGEAARIMTGAPIPEGTEAIVPVERARRDGGRVVFEVAPSAGAHVRRRGESIAAGARLLERGRRLRPADIALAALAGADPVSVFRAPRIAVAATGDEVVRGSERPSPGRLRDSNGPMLVAECQARGWPVRRLAAVADEAGAVAAMFAASGNEEDFLITTGGVSAGDLDLLPAAAEAAGFELLFHGVAMRPGKPVAFARRGGAFWLGLPGNPVSASVGFRIFGCEALSRFEGDAEPAPPRFRAILGGPLPPAGDRDRFFDAVCAAAPEGIRATPLRSSGSHDLGAFARANALIHGAAGTPALAAGAEVRVLLLGAIETDGTFR